MYKIQRVPKSKLGHREVSQKHRIGTWRCVPEMRKWDMWHVPKMQIWDLDILSQKCKIGTRERVPEMKTGTQGTVPKAKSGSQK